ncbi:MAG: dihydroneopterin aldolase [Verrucomicrobia bacterium]|nr:dihydroneopterin aldolase [Verrucomicrobiota bacterium]
MDTITLRDLEVHYHIGVPDEERVHPQRLLISVEMETDIRPAAAGDDLAHTINYYAVSQRLLGLGRGRSWRLIETLVSEIADLVLREFGARRVHVEVRKFIIPEARHVSVRITRPCHPDRAG